MQAIMGEKKARDFSGMLSAKLPVIEMETEESPVIESAPASKRSFHLVPVTSGSPRFSREWNPTMSTLDYIGETEMILKYLQSMERLHGISMPIKACGIDPIVFNHVSSRTYPEMDGAVLFHINDSDDGFQPDDSEDTAEDSESSEGEEIPTPTAPAQETEKGPLYELIKVDGELYLSCASESLDESYVNSVIAEATTAIKQTGSYVFQLVCYRKLTLIEPGDAACLLNTLRLNTYELSVLIAYMQQFEGISIEYTEVDGKESIIFRL